MTNDEIRMTNEVRMTNDERISFAAKTKDENPYEAPRVADDVLAIKRRSRFMAMIFFTSSIFGGAFVVALAIGIATMGIESGKFWLCVVVVLMGCFWAFASFWLARRMWKPNNVRSE
jgi:hypothetical protein